MSRGSRRNDGQDGDAEAYRHFETLYRAGWSLAWSAARPLLPCDGDADDAAQRVFTRLWSRVLKGSLDIARADQFFRQSGRREALLILRERCVTSPLTDQLDVPLTCGGPTPERQIVRAELRGILCSMIDELPPRCRAVMRAIVYEGLTHPEIARSLGVGVGAVEKQVARAYASLREHLVAMVPDVAKPDLSTFMDGGGRTFDSSYKGRALRSGSPTRGDASAGM